MAEQIRMIPRSRVIRIVLALLAALCCYHFLTLQAQADSAAPKQDPVPVWFTSDISAEGVMNLYDRIKEHVHGKTGIKVHFGEKGNPHFIRPDLLKPLQQATGAAFVETNVIYPGPRQTTDSHIALAREHGFGYAPIDILDSEGETAIPVDMKHFNEVWVGSRFGDYDTYIMCSHFKGHGMAGFGGAIKNISMGMGSRKGKTAMHASHYPHIDPEKCINCGLCISNCATDAITLEPVVVDPTKCVGCGKCIAACPQKVFTPQKRSRDRQFFMEKLAEYAHGISAATNMLYINFVNNISPDCDCSSHPDDPFVHDIGVVASTDPVAIDKACLDLVNQAAGSEDAFYDVNSVSGNRQLDYGEQLGMGSQKYVLIDLDR